MRLAVVRGARVNEADERGMTPLLRATSNVLVAGATAVQALLHAGADPDQRDEAGATALCVAASLKVQEDSAPQVRGCGCVYVRTCVCVCMRDDVQRSGSRRSCTCQTRGRNTQCGACIDCHDDVGAAPPCPAWVRAQVRAKANQTLTLTLPP